MLNFPKRKENVYETERVRLLDHLNSSDPETEQYAKVLDRLDQLDKLHNRTTEFKKTIIPALTTAGSVAGIYALQQFAGVIVPKALETLASKGSPKNHSSFD